MTAPEQPTAADEALVDGLAQWLAFRDGASWGDAPPDAKLMWRSIARHGLEFARAASSRTGGDFCPTHVDVDRE